MKEVLRPKLHSENDLAQVHAAGFSVVIDVEVGCLVNEVGDQVSRAIHFIVAS